MMDYQVKVGSRPSLQEKLVAYFLNTDRIPGVCLVGSTLNEENDLLHWKFPLRMQGNEQILIGPEGEELARKPCLIKDS